MGRKRFSSALLAAAAGLCAAGVATAQQGGGPIVYADQGTAWTQALRLRFYTQDQGSQLMPLLWLRALKTADGQPFLGNNLARYGYLPNPASAAGLPVGFTAATSGQREMVGMNCAACHTREIIADSKTYRIDGGPAVADFEKFLIELDDAVGRALGDPAAFKDFASAVLGGDASKPSAVQALRKELALYHQREHAIVTRSLPRPDMWGLGRLDAVSMIFNRIAGLDIGPPPAYLIEGNIAEASSPVRYPFLWNAPKQDYTQWPGFAPNGDDLLGLARNSGEVYGVFATFHPRKDFLGLADLHTVNSANFRGLNALESLLWDLGPPKWPFGANAELLARGEAAYNKILAHGGDLFQQHCATCHGEKDGEFRSVFHKTWATPRQDVGTDSREYDVLKRTVATDWLADQRLPFIFSAKVGDPVKASDLLADLVIGAMVQRLLELPAPAQAHVAGVTAKPAKGELTQAEAEWKQRTARAGSSQPVGFAYEARVLHGIWATAPYLHNGSVPTLAALLTLDEQRPPHFEVGRYYDTQAVGLAADQKGTGQTRVTTGCGPGRNSGNSRCGHNYAVGLSADDKAALLEYLKTL
jgi:mono/diheme cytochrome c family protein